MHVSTAMCKSYLKAFWAIKSNMAGIFQILTHERISTHKLHHPLQLRSILGTLHHIHHHLGTTDLPETLI